MKISAILVILLTLSGCSATYQARLEVDAAELSNQLRLNRQEFQEFKQAAKDAAEFEEDRKILDDLGRILDKDMERAHKRALELHKKIQESRNK